MRGPTWWTWKFLDISGSIDGLPVTYLKLEFLLVAISNHIMIFEFILPTLLRVGFVL